MRPRGVLVQRTPLRELTGTMRFSDRRVLRWNRRHSQQTKIGSAPMKKKPLVLSFPKTKAVVQSNRSWHNGGDIEIALYARSLHRAAKTLVETLELQPNPKTAWDACPVVMLYITGSPWNFI